MLRFFVGVLVSGCAIIISISLDTFFLYTHPKRYLTPITPKNLNLEYEDVTLQTKDGVALSGWLIPNEDSDSIVIICHGYPADKGDVLQLATFLRDEHNLFLFDFRGLGQSKGGTTLGDKEKTDVLTAVDYVKKRGFDKIGAFGFSMGGAVIIMSNSPDLSAAVTDSAFSRLEDMVHVVYENFGPMRMPFVLLTNLYARLFIGADIKTISPLSKIKNLRFPLFIIHAENDEVIPVRNAYDLHKADTKNKLWIIPSASHGETYSLRRGEYEEKIRGFFKTHL
jgi:dipeptidyl aminopeptidase/acylaminoacyl peptidase